MTTAMILKRTGIVEPSDDFHKKSNVMIGRTLATADENVPVCIMNPLNEEVVVYKGTIVGQFEQVNGDSNKVDLKKKAKICTARPTRRTGDASVSQLR